MTMRSLFLFILLFNAIIFNAQGFKVQPLIPAVLNSHSKFIFETNPNNYIAGGLVLDTMNNKQINQLAIMGLNSLGQVLWTKKYGNGKMNYVNNSFISRSFYKHGNFIYHTCSILDSNNHYVAGLIKFDFNGDTLWQKIYRDTLSNDLLIPQMVTSSVDGGFLITGYWFASNPGLLIKTDANGNELWRKKLGNYVLDGKAIVQDSVSKKIVIGGYRYFNGTNITDNFLVLDSLGNILSHSNYMSVGGNILDMIQTRDEKIVAVGYQYSTQTIGGNPLMRAYIVKFNLDTPATPVWEIDNFDKLALYNGFSCLKELSNGDILVSGFVDTLYGTIDSPNNLFENIQIRITIIDKNGTVKWNRYYNYKTNNLSQAYSQGIRSMELGEDGSWLAAIEGFNYPSVNPFFFVKYDSTGCDSSLAYCATLPSGTTVGVKEFVAKDFTIKTYPNPVSDYLTVEVGGVEAKTLEVCVSDLQGRELKRVSIKENEKIDLNDLKSGMYLITIIKGKEIIYVQKFIKE